MVPPLRTVKKSGAKKTAPTTKRAPPAKKNAKVTKKPPAAIGKPAAKKTTSGTKPVKKPAKPPAKKATKPPAKKGKAASAERYRCRLCGYIYSPLRGEPHNGIPAGTAFDDLPDTYVCPVCGQRGKGRIGKWGFDLWHPTRYLCSLCNYVYDEKRGEPHRGIKPGTKFEDLPDDYVCPVCALDPRIRVRFGKVFKQGFEPLQV
ncbi:MAG: rubredoxin [Methanomicrobiales archaeon HGW-Methanomicrobiales-3]|nr:MAG: rubredoxin [Methanomicrobiales archaeon HGW-Methanomicrobiales-3]